MIGRLADPLPAIVARVAGRRGEGLPRGPHLRMGFTGMPAMNVVRNSRVYMIEVCVAEKGAQAGDHWPSKDQARAASHWFD